MISLKSLIFESTKPQYYVDPPLKSGEEDIPF